MLAPKMREYLENSKDVDEIAKSLSGVKDTLYIGRQLCLPVALEGALKLKEISYIHAEGYAAGELKHGPLALVEEGMPVVAILPKNQLIFEKIFSNIKEIQARGAEIIAITEGHPDSLKSEGIQYQIDVPFISDELSPILLNIPLQLLAYYTAVHNGTDVDQPRNLAKSVTVE